ncbi:hypothetical protein Taro_040929, partial [Colocasia esculenta]|nr:hypothetical protein [Colocasia esculenta]
MKEGGGVGCRKECEVVGGISDGPEEGGPEEEEAPADDDTGGTSKIGGGGEMGVEDAGDELQAAQTLTPRALMALTPSQLALLVCQIHCLVTAKLRLDCREPCLLIYGEERSSVAPNAAGNNCRGHGIEQGKILEDWKFTHFCLGSVDTRSSQVDTRPSFQQISLPDCDSRLTLDPVDTRPSFQQISLTDWDSRSTLDQNRSTLDQ